MTTLPIMYGVDQGHNRSKRQNEMLANCRLSVCEETENKDREIDMVYFVIIKYEIHEERTACTFCCLCDEKSIIQRVHQKSACKIAAKDKIVSFRKLTRQTM